KELTQQHNNIPTTDPFTLISILKACGDVEEQELGKQIHEECILSNPQLRNNLVVNNALISMYGKLGMLTKARQVFETMEERNIVTWNAMLAAYSQNEQGKQPI